MKRQISKKEKRERFGDVIQAPFRFVAASIYGASSSLFDFGFLRKLYESQGSGEKILRELYEINGSGERNNNVVDSGFLYGYLGGLGIWAGYLIEHPESPIAYVPAAMNLISAVYQFGHSRGQKKARKDLSDKT